MSEQGRYEGIEKIVHITTGVSETCEECNNLLHGFSQSVNHYLDKHKYKLLHVGQQGGSDQENSHFMTVAVLGKQGDIY